MRTFVIAEIGSAWRFGEWKLQLCQAVEAIKIAKSANADCVKFQWVSDPRLMEQRRNVPAGSYDLLAWPKGWLEYLYPYCDEAKIEFMCTVFLPADVAVMNPYVNRWKVASLEVENEELIGAMRQTGKEIIVSHGASSGGIFAGMRNLHCTAAYPAPIEQLNLYAINTGYDGYSDHSRNVLTGAVAVACGAQIVEVHFRLPGTPGDNPDYGHSHTPDSLRDYIANIRTAELMLGDGDKKIEPCEEWALKHKVKS